MKKIVSILVLAAIALGVNAQNMKDVTFQFTEASELTLCGKMFNDTPTPYQRMDFSKSDKWSSKDINLLEMSSGISVAFETDSPIITVKVDWLEASEAQSSGFGTRGFDLYIKKDGKWLWAGIVSGRVSRKARGQHEGGYERVSPLSASVQQGKIRSDRHEGRQRHPPRQAAFPS